MKQSIYFLLPLFVFAVFFACEKEPLLSEERAFSTSAKIAEEPDPTNDLPFEAAEIVDRKLSQDLCPTGPGKPELGCYKKLEPVCGCNGVTYPNACFAKRAGAKNWAKGKCHPCQQFALIGSVSDFPEKYDPVCGCNGVVYANALVARNAGITDFKKGPCADIDINPLDFYE